MRALVIINPASGDGEPNEAKVPRIQAALAGGPFSMEVAYTTPERDARAIARDALADGVGSLIVGGGDGTVSEVARELVHTEATLGILPLGTFNNIARSLGIPGDLAQACGVVRSGQARAIDAGIANGKEYFFEAAGAGLDAALFPIGEEIKGGRWSRIFQAAKLMLQHKRQLFRIEFDCTIEEAVGAERGRRYFRRALGRRHLHRRAHLIVAANGPYYGGGFTVAAGARVGDGKLTLSIYEHFSKLELIRHFRSIFRGQYHYSPKIETFTAKEVRLSSRHAIPVHLDGHPFGCTPVDLAALPGALRVFAPRKPGGESSETTAFAAAAAEQREEAGTP